ncbi:hypothetical protein GW17_00001565 [Ensete ventricosum]|nr:hypothetical protein GW17_00001565 [Ensete ventricosum]RZS08127.1 hypothetical protein BHM03_00039062 [Ensete ventricosum]
MDGLMRELDVSNLTCGLERIHTESTVLLTQDATAENLSWVPRTPVLFSPIITWVADATDELLFRKHPRPFLRAPNLCIYSRPFNSNYCRFAIAAVGSAYLLGSPDIRCSPRRFFP